MHRIDTVSVLLQCCQGAVRVLSRCQKFQVMGDAQSQEGEANESGRLHNHKEPGQGINA